MQTLSVQHIYQNTQVQSSAHTKDLIHQTTTPAKHKITSSQLRTKSANNKDYKLQHKEDLAKTISLD